MLFPRSIVLSSVVISGFALAPSACSSGDGPEIASPSAENAVVGERDGIRQLAPGWNAIPGPEGTACSDGSPFSFYVRPGSVNRVVLEFSGGGACWDALTCALANDLFSATVDPNKLPWSSRSRGIYDHERADNPFKDWHHVFIPYCTGDVHWGSNDADYGIKHYGARNSRAVLDWLYANVSSPEKMFTTGCSAGGYGSIVWSAYARQHYPNTKHYQFSDSAAGAITPSFFEQIRATWKFADALPTFVPGLADAASVPSLDVFYEKIGNHFPDMPIAQFNTRYDAVQAKYFELLGSGDVTVWSQKLVDSMRAIHASTPTFKSYVGAGTQHCVLPRADFYTAKVGEERVLDFISRMVNDQPVANVDCGADCGMP